MKIGIDIRSTLKRSTGIGRYTFNLINALARIDPTNEYLLYSVKKFLDFKRHLPALPGKNFCHYVDYFKKGPEDIMPEVDVFHSSSYDLKRPRKARYIVTIHDVIIKAYPYGHSKKTIDDIDEMMKRVLKEADILVADSNSTRSDLINYYDVNPDRIEVIYPGININKAWQKRGEFLPPEKGEKYILFVGTLEPRKNIDGLIKAFDFLKKNYGIEHKLYIVGMKGWMFEDIFKAYNESEFKRDIIFKGYVSDNALEELYRRADIFVYPSFYEGFGFPILEAFSFGLPVVTSHTSSCGEIAGGYALTIDPSNYREIGEAILKLINDEELKISLRCKAPERAREFSWDKTAKAFLRLFTEGRV